MLVTFYNLIYISYTFLFFVFVDENYIYGVYGLSRAPSIFCAAESAYMWYEVRTIYNLIVCIYIFYEQYITDCMCCRELHLFATSYTTPSDGGSDGVIHNTGGAIFFFFSLPPAARCLPFGFLIFFWYLSLGIIFLITTELCVQCSLCISYLLCNFGVWEWGGFLLGSPSLLLLLLQFLHTQQVLLQIRRRCGGAHKVL